MPPRAPPSHAQRRTSPPCALAALPLLPGKETRSGLRRRLLKGQHRPALPILPWTAPPSPPKHLSRAPEGWDSPSPSLASPKKRRLSIETDWTGGAGGGTCPDGFAAAATAVTKAAPGVATSAAGPAGEPGAPSSARRGLQRLPRLRCWESLEAGSGFFLARSPFAVLVEMFFPSPVRPYPP